MFDYNSYYEAITIDDAINALISDGKTKIIAGGTDVLIKLREHHVQFTGCNMVGITRIPELQGVQICENGDISIGACTTFTQIEQSEIVKKHLPTLGKAAGLVGGPQIRNVGTIGGNVANGATSADTASVLFTFNAIVIIQNTRGIFEIPINEFYISAGKVKLEQGDLLTAIKIKKQDYENFKGEYIKFAVRKAMDIANLSCAVLIKCDNNAISDLRISFGVAASTPIRATNAEEFAIGKELTNELIVQIGEKCLENTQARDSWRASKAFRNQLIKTLPKKAILQALGGVSND